MLKVENLTVAFGQRVLFENQSFSIGADEKIGLIGRNGTGKSSLLKFIKGEMEAEEGQLRKPFGYKIGYLQQHMQWSYETVIEEVCAALPEHHKYDEWRAERCLMGLGFGVEQMIANPEAFSGGWQIKIQLAKIFLAEVDLLLLDEPTNYLDIASVRWLKKELKNWPNAMILITHDRSFLDAIIDHTLYIHRNKIRKMKGDSQILFTQVEQEDQLYERLMKNEQKQRDQEQAWIDKNRAKASMATRVQSRVKRLEKKANLTALSDEKEAVFNFHHVPFRGKMPLIKLEKIGFYYQENQWIFRHLSMAVSMEEKIGIIGKNGAGKSTLMKVMARILIEKSGQTIFNEKCRWGYFGQSNINTLDLNKSIGQTLESFCQEVNAEQVHQLASLMCFEEIDLEKKVKVLSGGEKARLSFAKMMTEQKNVLLLDEPTNHLDMYTCEGLIKALKKFQGAVVVISHNEGLLHEVCDKLVVFDGGEIKVYHKSYQNFLEEVGWSDEK